MDGLYWLESMESRQLLSAAYQPALRSADLSGVKSFAYQLQDVDLVAMGQSKFDMTVIDYSADGSDELRYSARQIRHLRNSPGGSKVVLAYMSIGEAENYRWYWGKYWDSDGDGIPNRKAPGWLAGENPDWEGNYEVRYWDQAWQTIVRSYLDRVIDAGFDGTYFDIVDAYEYWGPGGDSGVDRAAAEREMVDFVKSLAQYARETRGRHRFAIFVQNGEGLSSHADYVNTVNGIGREDLWYNGNVANPQSEIDYAISSLDVFKSGGKTVLVIDYVTEAGKIDEFYSKASAKGYVGYATVRDLDRLTVNKGHEPT